MKLISMMDILNPEKRLNIYMYTLTIFVCLIWELEESE